MRTPTPLADRFSGTERIWVRTPECVNVTMHKTQTPVADVAPPEMLARAQRLIEMGFSVIPLQGKLPVLSRAAV